MGDRIDEADRAIRRPPYRDGFPGPDAWGPWSRYRWVAWVFPPLTVFLVSVNVAMSPHWTTDLGWGLIGLFWLWQSARAWRSRGGPPLIGPDGVDFGAFGVPWSRITEYRGGFVYVDPPLEVRESVIPGQRTDRVRLGSFDPRKQEPITDAIRRFQPRLLEQPSDSAAP